MTTTPAASPTPPGSTSGTGASRAEQRRRSSLVRQAWRFAVLNLKILRLTRQHH